MNITKAQIKKAIPGSLGIISAIARKVGCSRQTLYKKLEKYPELKVLVDQETETNIDYAEQKLIKAINEDSLTAIIFYLKTKGKHRGYIETYEQINPQEIKVQLSDELKAMLED